MDFFSSRKQSAEAGCLRVDREPTDCLLAFSLAALSVTWSARARLGNPFVAWGSAGQNENNTERRARKELAPERLHHATPLTVAPIGLLEGTERYFLRRPDRPLRTHTQDAQQREEKRGHYHVMACDYGSFQRAVPLPAEVDVKRARARYRNGVLHVTLPKTARGRGRRVTVEVK